MNAARRSSRGRRAVSPERQDVMVPRQLSDEPHRPPFQYRKPVKGSLVWWLRFLGIVAFLIILMRLPN